MEKSREEAQRGTDETEARALDGKRRELLRRLGTGAYVVPTALVMMTMQAHAS